MAMESRNVSRMWHAGQALIWVGGVLGRGNPLGSGLNGPMKGHVPFYNGGGAIVT